MKTVISIVRLYLAGMFVLLLAACGGGSSGGSDSDNKSDPVVAEKIEQSELSFEDPEVEYYLNSEVRTNTLTGGSGSGEVKYSSSNPNVATVDSASGTLQLISVGEATISAVKSGNAEYKSAAASYLVKVLDLIDQDPLVFESETVVADRSLHDTFVNPLSGGSGQGALSFLSSNEAIASIDKDTGEVTLIANGVTTIQVTKAAESSYKAATAEYELTVTGPPDVLEINVGKLDSQLSLNGSFAPTNIYRYTNEDCDIENYAVCSQGNLTVVADEGQLPVDDSYISVDLPAFVVLERAGARTAPIKVEAKRPAFVRRMGQTMISFKGKLFVIAGQDNSAGESGNDTYWYNDIWSTVDGKSWVREAEAAEFSPRAFQQVVEYHNSLYLIGGEEGIGTGGALLFKRDVWKSDDGVHWLKLIETGPFLGQGQSIVFNDKIWVIGDGAFSGESTIYSSTDGVNWDLELAESPFGSREQEGVYVWQNRLFIAGGMAQPGSDNLLSDVWSSPDGRAWTQESADAGYGARVGMSVVAFGDRLLMTGGHSFPMSHNTVYTSSDGVSWSLLVPAAVKTMNQTHALAEHAGKLWLYSGLSNDYLWSSDDGEHWTVPVEFQLDWQAVSE